MKIIVNSQKFFGPRLLAANPVSKWCDVVSLTACGAIDSLKT